MKRADLIPPLGYPGGPCQVVQRIREEVRNPRLQQELIEDVETGQSLDNPEAAQVYDQDTERGADKVVQRIVLGPHAQYRMDLRGITIPLIRASLRNFQQYMNNLKSRGDRDYFKKLQDMDRDGVDWVDPKLGLTMGFVSVSGGVKVKTVYWTVDPRESPPGLGKCATGYRTDDLSGYRTLVEDPHPQDQEGGQRKDRLLPSPPWQRSKPFHTPVYNGPGESGSQPDGKSLSKDKPRTLGKPGEDSPPNPPDASHTITPKRRPLSARGTGGTPFPIHRQKEQQGVAEKYQKRYYRKNKSEIQRRSLRWYNKHKRNPLFKKYKDRLEEFPTRFERKPGGVRSPAERTKEWREENEKLSVQRVVADFLYEKRPPDMDPDTWQDRGMPPPWLKKRYDERERAWGDVERGEVVPSGPGKTIPQDSDFANRQAARIAEIQALCGGDLIQRSRNIPVKLHRVNPDKKVWLFDVKGSKGATYRVRLKAVPTDKKVLDPSKMDVLVSCSCPFWQWQGPEYWAKQNEYLYGKPRGTASQPNEKDPLMDHGACKHVLAVFNRFKSFLLPDRKQLKVGSFIQMREGDLSRLDSVVGRYLMRAILGGYHAHL